MRKYLALLALVSTTAFATSFSGGGSADGQALGLDNKGYSKVVVQKCSTNTAWFQCKTTAADSQAVKDGEKYFNETTNTIGPNGTIKNADGSTIFISTNACTSCHFGGGKTPGGNPVYQSPDKYSVTGGVYFRAFNYKRDLADSINDCIKNCGGGNPVPKDGTVMQALVAYVQHVRDSVTDVTMKNNPGWKTMPGEAMPVVNATWTTMTASVSAGQSAYSSNGCSGCHDKDGAGMGELRSGEARPRVPALWGDRSYTWGAAYGQTPQLAGVIKNHMPYGKNSYPFLGDQTALNIAAFINSKPRPVKYAADMFCQNDPTTGFPNTLYKPAQWQSGCKHPEENFPAAQYNTGPWAPITTWRAQKLQALQAANGGN